MRRKGKSACPAEIAFDFSLLASSLRVSLQSSLYQMVLVHREGRERGAGRSRCRCGAYVSGKGKAGRVNAWPIGSLILLLVFGFSLDSNAHLAITGISPALSESQSLGAIESSCFHLLML